MQDKIALLRGQPSNITESHCVMVNGNPMDFAELDASLAGQAERLGSGNPPGSNGKVLEGTWAG